MVMRLFVAVTLEQELKKYLKGRQDALRGFCRRGNFSRPENLHLTVKFLGEVDRGRLPAVIEAMAEGAGAVRPFQLQLGSLGHFSRGEKKILWVGLQGELERLQQLFRSVEEAMDKRGFPKENRPLKAHITMAREAVLAQSWEKVVESLAVEPKPVPVTGITLMESTRINGVLTYRPLHRQPLE
jgi:2'-5' RNA ligase